VSVFELSVDSELLGYRVEAVLGRGGMSVVYLAEDLRLKRRVALKLLAPALAEDEAFRGRFLVESELAASLDHPNIVPIYAAGEANQRLFIAMRYVEGHDLKQLLRDGPVSPVRTIEVCAQVAEALDFAHERGLVHRDVKPSNVLLDARGHVYLADFGLTKRLAEPRAVEPGLFGTIDYIAPEQIRDGEVDGRADVYSLGCLLCECLTGEPPFHRATDAAALFAHLEEEPPAPPGLAQVIPRALAKEPHHRYGTCAELVGAAREALGLGEPRPKWWRRPYTLTLAGALIALALLVFLMVGVGSGAPGASLVRIDPRTDRVAAQVAVGNDPLALAADANGVWVANHDGTVWRFDAHTDRVISRSPAYGVPADLALLPANIAAFGHSSPGGAVVVNGPSEPGVVEINAASGGTTVFRLADRGPGVGGEASAGAGAPRVATGPSGIWVARPDRRVGRFDVNTGRLVQPLFITPPPDERGDSYFSGIAVGAGGVWVLGDPNDPMLWRIDPATGKLTATIPLPFAPTDVAVGDGAVWVTSALANTLARIDPSTNRVTAAIPAGKGAGAVAVGGGSVWVADQVGGAITRIDQRTLRVINTITLNCGFPVDLAVADGVVWAAARR
jgi:DNA-binding beta-propeller fold protein YncE/tRNA A-37 threonylcarbamoyl transferase component Bud32